MSTQSTLIQLHLETVDLKLSEVEIPCCWSACGYFEESCSPDGIAG